MNKKFIKFFSVIFCIVLLIVLAMQMRPSKPIRFTILYTSDTHGHVASSETAIGLDQIGGIKKALAPSLLLDAGDFSDGDPMAVLSRGEDIVRLMKKAGYFAAAIGNHEFTYGLDILKQRIAEAKEEPGGMAIISANVMDADQKLLSAPSARASLEDVEICVFGLTTPETKTQGTPEAVAGLNFLDPIQVSQNVIKDLRASGCKVLISLAHIGNDVHVPLKSTEVASAVNGLDIMIDGHSHISFEHKTQNGTVVVSPGANGRQLGRLEVEYDRGKNKINSISNFFITPEQAVQFTPDASLTAEINDLQKNIEAQLSQPVGTAEYDLDGDRASVRVRETNLGDLCADALRAAHQTDFALANGGSIRGSIKKGPVTGRDILSVYPFAGEVVSFQITGHELKEILEHGVGFIPGASGAFPQISGFSAHIKAEAPKGWRVHQILMPDGSPVDMDKKYTIAVTSFTASGGDGYDMLADRPYYAAHSSPQESLENHIKLIGTQNYPPELAGRLIFLP